MTTGRVRLGERRWAQFALFAVLLSLGGLLGWGLLGAGEALPRASVEAQAEAGHDVQPEAVLVIPETAGEGGGPPPGIVVSPAPVPIPPALVTPVGSVSATSQRFMDAAQGWCCNLGHRSQFDGFGGSQETHASFLAFIADSIGHLDEIGGVHADPQAMADWFRAQGRWGHVAVPGAVQFYDLTDGAASVIRAAGICRIPQSGRSATGAQGCEMVGWDRDEVRRRNRIGQTIGFGYPLWMTVDPPFSPIPQRAD
ncbi:MAG: hypothetical protein FWG11_09350 [Promicromonosporaceae bacterium]|nr:hypothetical protein [Promicromonosporaceae bacterium]